MTDRTHEIVEHAEVLEAPGALHPIVEKILAKDPTPETLEKVLAIQREYEKEKQKRAFTAALVELKKDLPPFILRDKEVKFDKNSPKVEYTHASLANVYATINPILAKHGFCLNGKPDTKNGQVIIKARLTHYAGHSEEAELAAAPDTKGSKNPAQAVGSTMTALTRYAGLCLLGLATADMDDENNMGRAAAARDDEAVDPAKNAQALQQFIKLGKTKADVENFLKKPIADWTESDIDSLRKWHASLTPTTKAAVLQPKPVTAANPTKPEDAQGVTQPEVDGDPDLSIFDYHCDGCDYHTKDESMLVDHQAATGHRTQEQSKSKPKGGKSK